jgi:signal transduction histidine kinase
MTELSPADVELLLQASRALSSKLDLAELLPTVMDYAARVVKAEASSVLLLDEEAQELYFDVALGEAGSKVKSIRLKVGEGVAGWVAARREAAIVNDVHSDARWSARGDAKSEFTTRQILAVPVLLRDRLIGVVEALNKQGGGDFTDGDRRTLEAFAAQVAIAVENARLFAQEKSEKEALARVFSQMAEGALLVDERGRVHLMNNAAGHWLGRTDGGVSAMNLQGLTRDFLVCPPLDDLSVLDPRTRLELIRRAGKPLYLEGAITRLSGEGGRPGGYLVVLHDVTESRREELLKRNFLSLISHKLKTPLVVITGYAPLLAEGAANLNDFQKKAMAAIREQGQKLASLVDKLLAFSLLESDVLVANRRTLAVKELVQAAVSLLGDYLRNQKAVVTLDASLDRLPAVTVDGDRLREALRNLIENAVKFNPKTEKNVWVRGDVDPRTLSVIVEDNGPGVPPEEQPKLFQRFYQVEESFTGQVEGAGLGLALVRRVAEAHGGRAEVESVLGRGSQFRITLPLDS